MEIIALAIWNRLNVQHKLKCAILYFLLLFFLLCSSIQVVWVQYAMLFHTFYHFDYTQSLVHSNWIILFRRARVNNRKLPYFCSIESNRMCIYTQWMQSRMVNSNGASKHITTLQNHLKYFSSVHFVVVEISVQHQIYKMIKLNFFFLFWLFVHFFSLLTFVGKRISLFYSGSQWINRV